MSASYQALISDLGGVVVHLDFGPFNAFLAERAGLERERVWQMIEDEGSWKVYELGELDAAGFARALSQRLGAEITTEEFLHHWSGIFPGEIAGIGPLFEKVKRRGLELLALSNTNADHIGIIHEICPAMALFDRVYCSHEIHARKPDPASYRHVTRERGIEPQRCIFVDDLAENVRAAEALGMRGILATEPARIAAALRALGVLEGS